MIEHLFLSTRFIPVQMWAASATQLFWALVVLCGKMIEGSGRAYLVLRRIDHFTVRTTLFIVSKRTRREIMREATKRARKNIRAKA